MKTVFTTFQAQTEVKRSKFLAFLVPIGDFAAMHEKLKADHPKANHIVWAKRWFNDRRQLEEASSDDGEPKGCAGKPVLQVLRGNGLVECAIFVVRYFGGIKLGTGGMARAYGAAAKVVVELADTVPYEPRVRLRFHLPFEQIAKWEHRLKEIERHDESKRFDESGVWWQMAISENAKTAIADALEKARIPFSVE